MNKKLKQEELGRIDVDQFKEEKKLPLIIWLNNIRSLSNVGSFFRTADAFRIKEIWCQGITATPPHREINKTALGATHSITWRFFQTADEALSEIADNGYNLIALEQTEQTTKLQDLTVEEDKVYVLVVGNEVEGVEQNIIEKSNEVIEIPQYGTKHSLNVSISGGIFIWEFFKKVTEGNKDYFSMQSHPARS